MVSRQRESKITQKGSEMSSFLELRVYCKSLSRISPQRESLIMFSLYCPCKHLQSPLYLDGSFHVLLEFFKMSVKDLDFERYSASHFGVILYESLKQLHIVFSLLITQEAMNNCNETVPSRFLLPAQQLDKLITFYDLLDLRSSEGTSLDLCLG